MARDNERRERKDKTEKFQTFNRPKLKIARTSASGKTYIDYKDTESLKKMVSGNGKILSRKRTGATAMEQRMIARAVKRAPLPGRRSPTSSAAKPMRFPADAQQSNKRPIHRADRALLLGGGGGVFSLRNLCNCEHRAKARGENTRF